MKKSILRKYDEVKDWFQKPVTKLAFDTESESLRLEAKVCGMSFCDGERACYIDLWNNPEQERILNEIWQCISYAQLLIGHNISYDIKVFKSLGFGLDGVDLYDTQVAVHLLNENTSTSLKDLARRKFGYKRKEWKEIKDSGFNSKTFCEYGLLDAHDTWKLYELTKPLIDKDFADLFYNIEMPFQWVLVDLEWNGIAIDQIYLKDLDDSLVAKREILEIECVESLGLNMIEEKDLFGFTTISSPINFNSPKQIKGVFRNLNIKLPIDWKTGKETTAKKYLEPIRNQHKFIDKFLEFKKVEKLHNTFVHPLWNKIYPDDRLRPNFNDALTVSGRLSSSDPNGQNFPQPTKDDYKVRKIFKSKAGYKLIEGDWSGQELRVCGIVSKDKNMLDAFNKKKDLHLTTANEWFELKIPEEALYENHPNYEEYKKKYYDKRHIGKNGVNFPIIYDTSAYGIAINNHISKEKAQKGIDIFYKLYPDVKWAKKDCWKQLCTKHYVQTMLGRRRRFWTADKEALRQAFNHLIQGFCADLLRIAMIQLRQLYLNHPEWDAKLVLTVHDSIVTEAKEEYAGEVAREKKQVMENCYKLPILLPVDIKIVDNLG